jgi:hypothetical protein
MILDALVYDNICRQLLIGTNVAHINEVISLGLDRASGHGRAGQGKINGKSNEFV